jgi:SAM-dependent methyltransferase
MGRFESTAASYAAWREPYPPMFFAAAAEALRLGGVESLIDVGAGPGLIAIGFAPYVGRVLGVDPEPAMVAEARRAAAAANVDLTMIEGRVEDVVPDLGPFDLMTIGRALHWLDRKAALAAFDRILAPGGRILICRSASVGDEENPWRPAYEAVLRAWGDARDGGHRGIHEHWFDGTRFARRFEIKISHVGDVRPEALVERALTRSTSSPAVLGPRIGAFRAELLAALAPFFPEGARRETLEAKAVVFAAT